MTDRMAKLHRQTTETDVGVELYLDGSGRADIETGIGFLDHLLETLSRHARIDLRLRCRGDLHIDDHHSVEDCGLVLGQAFDVALGEKTGIARFGSSYAPLDDALARAVVDFCGRPFAAIDLSLTRERLGMLACENVAHFLESFAMAAKVTLHVDVLKGRNEHHRAEAAFKATALAVKSAIAVSGFDDVPSTKGVLTGEAL